MTRRYMTDQDAENIRRLASKGATTPEIAAELDIDRRRVREWAMRIGVKVRAIRSPELPPRPWSDEDNATLARRYPDEPTSAIAADLGRSIRACYTQANKLGLIKSEAFHQSEHSARNKPAEGSTLRRMGEWRVYRGQLQKQVGPRKWVGAPHAVWVEHGRAIPEGLIAVFKQGMATTDPAQATIDRIELITRSENMRRNSLHTRYPPEVTGLIQMNNALKRKITNRLRENER